ncbi:MAG: hypothetical protein AAGF12_36415 [Myxococcota bacterium]
MVAEPQPWFDAFRIHQAAWTLVARLVRAGAAGDPARRLVAELALELSELLGQTRELTDADIQAIGPHAESVAAATDHLLPPDLQRDPAHRQFQQVCAPDANAPN